MNKFKKLATMAVSTVMAGTMIFSFTACTDNPTPGPVDSTNNRDYWDEAPTLDASLTPKLDENGNLTYAANTELRLNVGNSATQTTAYTTSELTGSWTFPDGKSYTSGSLKPAWAKMADQLGLKFTDAYVKDDRIKTTVKNGHLGNYDVITGSLSEAVEQADSYLNINDYIYYMPNYKAFLLENQATLWSLTGDASNGAMYAAPYFDGNDDIEKYDMVRRDWVRIILDNDGYTAATTTYKAQATAKNVSAATSAAAESYMGTTGSWEVATTDPSDTTKTTTVKVNYDAALSAAKDTSKALGKAISDAAGSTYNGTSGNIVDLQNYVINAKSGEVTGAQLIAILRAYIDVAYTTSSGAQFYSTRSDVFNSASAAWDVDLLVGLLRCVVTSEKLYDSTVQELGTQYLYGIMARQNTTQRRVDMYALAGELYGVRGMESRYEYTYIDNNGKLQDARTNAESYDLLSRFSTLAKEGLLYTGDDGTDGKNSFVSTSNKAMSFMTHDYVQTQTRFSIEGSTNSVSVPDGYDFAPIVTPVSKWNVDGDDSNGHEVIMRFTESWRSVKNTGFSIPKVNVTNNPDKLSAILAFIDYMFSSDGQIVLTYGTASSSATNPDGWWYCKESDLSLSTVADVSVEATNYLSVQYTVKDQYKQQVFVYDGKVYEGLKYADRCVPKMTDASKAWFLGQQYNGCAPGDSGLFSGISSVVGNYTNYARQVLGTTLPIGNKDQGFEYQCTAALGLDGAAVVATAINNGTIKHVKISTSALSEGEGFWYIIAPTALPLTSAQRGTIGGSAQLLISGTYFLNGSSTQQITNIYLDILFYGLGASNYICGDSAYGSLKTSGAAYIDMLGSALTERINIFKVSWDYLNSYYEITG